MGVSNSGRTSFETRFTTRPVSPENFVGRLAQIEAIVRGGLDPAGGRLINVAGPEKIGRTSLLLHVQHLARKRYGSGKVPRGASVADIHGSRLRIIAPYVNLRMLESELVRAAAESASPSEYAVRAAVERQLASEICREVGRSGAAPHWIEGDGAAIPTLHEAVDLLLSIQDD